MLQIPEMQSLCLHKESARRAIESGYHIMFKRVRLYCGDQNSEIEKQLPIAGIISAEIAATEDTPRWLLLRLKRLLTYDHRQYRYVLIASRWVGRSISFWYETSVSILLVDEDQLPLPMKIEIDSYFYAAWALCRRSLLP